MIARLLPVSDGFIAIGRDQAIGDCGTEENMVEAKARIATPRMVCTGQRAALALAGE
jgi:hypothetical protein